ncbi:hypothetical protein AB837_00323 [bacterium AB1]|nr:hypothetical protein AB837_00323 [bacterium AB1]
MSFLTFHKIEKKNKFKKNAKNYRKVENINNKFNQFILNKKHKKQYNIFYQYLVCYFQSYYFRYKNVYSYISILNYNILFLYFALQRIRTIFSELKIAKQYKNRSKKNNKKNNKEKNNSLYYVIFKINRQYTLPQNMDLNIFDNKYYMAYQNIINNYNLKKIDNKTKLFILSYKEEVYYQLIFYITFIRNRLKYRSIKKYLYKNKYIKIKICLFYLFINKLKNKIQNVNFKIFEFPCGYNAGVFLKYNYK